MFKKTMKFDDLDGNEVTQTFYFNFNKKEIAELLEFGAIQKFADPDREYLPLEEMMARLSTPIEESGLTQVENNRQAYRIFQDLILDAYGVKGEDNVTFDKTHKLRAYWESHVAFPEMIFEFLEDEKLASQFVENCLPPRIVAKAKEDLAAQNEGKLSSTTLSEMAQEAERRQQDPATRIEPGPEAASKALGPNPAVETLAKSVASEQDEKLPENPTAGDIQAMDDATFSKIDPQKLSREAMLAAFKRKSQS